MMHAAVRSGRGKKLKADALQGDMFFADAAIANGLADEKGDFSYAVSRALELAGGPDRGEAVEEDIATDPGNPEELLDEDAEETPNATHLTPNSMFGKNKFPAVAALANLEGAALTTALVDAANEELEAAGITGAALVTAAAFEGMEASIGATAAALKAAGVESIAALVAQRDEARTQADEFGSQPGELPTTAAKLKGDVTEEGGDEYAKTVEALHKKMLGEA
ncbi:hypothetical protein, partial [Hymenobacter sp.]|uniref:hypothetical protein n=1 Tax=Hymenobacter sp. TaxID=1898978 RepID=UPI00286A04EA